MGLLNNVQQQMLLWFCCIYAIILLIAIKNDFVIHICNALLINNFNSLLLLSLSLALSSKLSIGIRGVFRNNVDFFNNFTMLCSMVIQSIISTLGFAFMRRIQFATMRKYSLQFANSEIRLEVVLFR